MSHYSVRCVQTRKEEKRITIEQYLDVKKACHRWLMKNDHHYRRFQEELPARLKYRDWDSEDNSLETKAEK